MDASVNTERKHAFVVRASTLKKIWDLFQNRIGETKIRIKCADGLDREFSNWKQFSSFDNPLQKKISRLIISSRSEDWKKLARVEFSDSSSRSIDIRIEGDERTVSRLYDEVTDILDGTRPWYSPITKIDFFYVIGFIVWFAYMIVNLYISDKPKGEGQSIDIRRAILFSAMGISIIGILALVIWGLNRLRSKYFPIAYFALGQGEERYKLDEKIRWSILVAFVVSFVASIIVTVFQ